MPDSYNPDAEYIVNVEPLNLYMLLVTYKDGYKCIFDFSEKVPKYQLYKEFQENPDSFYDFTFEFFQIGWKNVFIASDNIREVAIPFEDFIQWVREQMRINEELVDATYNNRPRMPQA